MNAPTPPKTIGSILVTQAIAIFGCVVIPGLVTWIAPRTTITLSETNQQPTAAIVKYVFLAIPFDREVITPLESVKSIVTAADRHVSSEERRRGRRGVLLADGSLLLSGGGREIQVQSTPTAAPREAQEISAFLAAQQREPRMLTATAGWPLTYLLGGAMTTLAAFYCLGASLATVKWFATLWLPR